MLERQEMIEILEEIARGSKSAVARIQAIKTLLVMEKDQSFGTWTGQTGFDALDDLYAVDEVCSRRKEKAVS